MLQPYIMQKILCFQMSCIKKIMQLQMKNIAKRLGKRTGMIKKLEEKHIKKLTKRLTLGVMY